MTGSADRAGLRRGVDEAVARAVEQAQAPGVVAAVAWGEQAHVATAGVMTVGGPPMDRDTLFRIASITKPVTASAVLSLVEDGRVDLDEAVDRLLPELADRQVLRAHDGPLDDTVPADRAVTVRDLLTFTWGFGMQGAMFLAPEPWPVVIAAQERELSSLNEPRPQEPPDPDTWMARLGELPLMAQPGERWLYSSGSQVLGVLAARADGKPLAQVLQERVFAPAGMPDTAFHTTDPARLATSYQRRDGRLEVMDPPDGAWTSAPAFPDGAAGLLSTVDDIVAFGRLLLGHGAGGLRPETVAEMTRNQLTPAQRAAVWPGFDLLDGQGWGLGVAVTDDGRYFWDGGLGTAWSNVPALDLTVVVLTQRAWDETGPPPVCAEVLDLARSALSA